MDVKGVLSKITVNKKIVQSKLDSLNLNDDELNFLIEYCIKNKIEILNDYTKEEYANDVEYKDAISLYINDIINSSNLLTREEEIELSQLVKQGDEKAREKFILSNLKLVISVAKLYKGKGVSIEDLVQEGNFGLFKAVEKFDSTKGYKFSTYAIWWIRNHISKAIYEQSHLIRVPIHMRILVNKYKVLLNKKITRGVDRKQIDCQIQEELNLDEFQLLELKKLLIMEKSISIQENVPNAPELVLENVIEEKRQNVQDESELNLLKDNIKECFRYLSEREKFIITMHFGLENDNIKTLSEIGAQLGISKERVRQIEERALKKLKIPGEKLQLNKWY